MKDLEALLGYSFRDKAILRLALTHPSYAQAQNEPNQHYQRLEFLGDSILSFILTDHICLLFPSEREGALATYRSALVHGAFLAEMGRKLDLPNHIILSEAEAKMGGAQKESILEDVVEALIAAIYLDSDLETTRTTVIAWYGDIKGHLENVVKTQNPKGQLQELVHKDNPEANLAYKVTSTKGPDHSKQFMVEVTLDGKVLATGEGPSKKAAEEESARKALDAWQGAL